MNANTPNAVQMAFYVPSHNTLYAWAKQQEGEWVTVNGSATLDAVRRIYPDTVLVTEAAALELQNAGYRRPWKETTEDYYVSQLEMLPPMDWCRGGVVQVDGIYGRGCDDDFCALRRSFFLVPRPAYPDAPGAD